MKNTRGICALLEPDEWFAGLPPPGGEGGRRTHGGEGVPPPGGGGLPGSPGGEGDAVPTAEKDAAARRRGQEGDKTPNGFLSPS